MHQGTGKANIRDYRAADREGVLSVWQRVFRETFSYLDDSPSEQQFRTYFDEVITPLHRVWVASANDQIIGFISASGAEIRNLFVIPTHQRRGVGTELLHTSLRAMPQARRVSTIAANTAARRFYEKNGFLFSHLEPHTFAGQQAAIYRRETEARTAPVMVRKTGSGHPNC